jgi:TolB-like protein/tetratricopeptide (TPR) repeat protein
MSFYKELKRRNVVRTAVTYIVVSWLLIQVGNTLFQTLELDASARKLLFAILLLGFIPAIIFSWAFEITPEGIKHERDVERDEAYTNLTGKKLDIVTIVLVILAMAMFTYDRYTRPDYPPNLLNQNLEIDSLDQGENISGDPDATSQKFLANEKSSIAVLAFANMSQDKSNSYFSDGISEEILNALVKVKGLRVVARSSSFAYKNQNPDLREIGEKLNADHVLEGSVRRDGDKVRITAQLISAKDGFHMWSDVYNRELNDIFTVQEEIAKSIVDALRLNIMPDSGVGKVATTNIKAYDLYLQGRASLRNANVPEDFLKAVSYFDSAIDLDTNFAEAYAARCDAFTRTYIRSRDSDLIAKAETACEQAQELDENAPQVLISKGELFITQGKFEQAKDLFAKAIVIRPNEASAHKGLGDALSRLGKKEEAIESLKIAIKLQPEDEIVHAHLGIIYFTLGLYQQAVDKFLVAIQLNPAKSNNYSNLGGSYFYLGEFGKAAETFRQSIAVTPNASAYSNAGTNYYFQGDYEAAYSMFQQAVDLIPADFLFRGNLADTCRWLNPCVEGAKAHYEKAIELADNFLAVNPNSLDARSQKAVYFSRIGKVEEATEIISSLLETYPENPDILYAAALIAVENKNAGQVKKYAKAALKFGFPEKALFADPDLKAFL